LDEAVRVAVEILQHWAPVLSKLELESGTHGVFRVAVDGQPVFDRAVLKRKPRTGEITTLLEPILGPAIEWRKHRTE
jgi:predicted Rdx family selenoprotein